VTSLLLVALAFARGAGFSFGEGGNDLPISNLSA